MSDLSKICIVGISGPIGSGKDTLASMLVEALEDDGVPAKQIGAASKVKDVVAAMFGWPRELLEGDTPESREFREAKDEGWSARLNTPISPRNMLQYVGTELVRDGLHPEFWLHCLELTILSLPDENLRCVVMPDMRFENSRAWIKGENPEMDTTHTGLVFRVERVGWTPIQTSHISEELPFPLDSFDLVVKAESLESLRGHARKMAAMVRDRLGALRNEHEG